MTSEAKQQRPPWAPVIGTTFNQVRFKGPMHVRGYVDGFVVIRHWVKSKQCWAYQFLDIEWFWVRDLVTEEQLKAHHESGIEE